MEIDFEKKINDLIGRMEQITYTTKSYRGEDSTYHMISGGKDEKTQQLNSLRGILRVWIDENLVALESERAMLEAKVYTYEQVIANSNFKMAIAKKQEGEEINKTIIEQFESIGLTLKCMDFALKELNDRVSEITEARKENA